MIESLLYPLGRTPVFLFRSTACAACGDNPTVTTMEDTASFASKHGLTVERLVPDLEEVPSVSCQVQSGKAMTERSGKSARRSLIRLHYFPRARSIILDVKCHRTIERGKGTSPLSSCWAWDFLHWSAVVLRRSCRRSKIRIMVKSQNLGQRSSIGMRSYSLSIDTFPSKEFSDMKSQA